MKSPAPALALALFLAAVILPGCGRTDSDAGFGDRVRAYLLAHPEVIQEAMRKLQDKAQADSDADAKKVIEQNRQALERDPRDFVANPNGKVTVTEFYDYRCPHCVNAAPGVLALIRSDPNVRFVFKEFPIFGDVSDQAAAGALAVKRAGGDYLAVYRDFMNARPLDTAAIASVLKAHNVDPASLSKPEVSGPITQQIADVRHLAIALGVEGTPAFIVGDKLLPGEDLNQLKAAIVAAETGKS